MSRNRWRSWLLRLEQIRLDVRMKTRRFKPAVCPTAWFSAWRGTFLTEKTARRAKLSAQGARRGDLGTQRSNVNQLLVHRERTHRDLVSGPGAASTKRRHRRSWHLSKRLLLLPAVCLQWERGKSCGVPATPWRWACGVMTAFNQVFTVPGIG